MKFHPRVAPAPVARIAGTARIAGIAGAAGIAGLTASVALLLEATGRLRFSSDQGIISLMALDILKRGAHPVFCYGAEYAGTLEAHFLALVFGLLGPSVAAFRIGVGLLFVLFVLATMEVARLAYGPRAALGAGLYLALGPSYLYQKGLTSDGSYTSLLLLLALCLLLLLRIEERFSLGKGALPELGLLGFLSGLTWWVHPLAIVIGPLAVVAAFLGTTRAWLRARGLILLVLGFPVGAFPWIWHNLRTGWLSLKAQEMAPAAAGRTFERVRDLFSQALPRLLGGRPVGYRDPSFPGALWVALLVFALLTGFAVRQLRRAPTRSGRLASALFLTLLFTIPLLSLGVARTDFKEPRYFLPLFLALAPLAGGLLAALRPRPVWAALVALPLLALGPGSEIAAPQIRNYAVGHVWSDPDRLLAGLAARGVHDVYTSYWNAYRLVFLSGERLRASPWGSGENGFVRHQRLRAELDRVPSPAFLLCCEDLRRLEAYLAREKIPYREEAVEGFTLLTGIPPAAVERLRACYCTPESPAPGSIAWQSIAGPQELPAAGAGQYRVSFENRGPQPLSSNVHLSYHWRPWRPWRGLDGGTLPVEGARADLPSPGEDWWRRPWRQVTADVRVPVAVPPGDYTLLFDLVDENVSWFEKYGISPAPYHVTVKPDAR